MSDRMYLPGGHVAHLVDPNIYSAKVAACGFSLMSSTDWHGTGSQDEYDEAARRPLCRRCAVKASP